MMYDNTCKYLAEAFASDFAEWLLGKPISFTTLEPSELTAQPIRADSIIFLQSDDQILHIEFQTRTDSNIPFRMLNYWVRLYDKYPTKTIHQVVIYLCKTTSPLVYQDKFQVQQTSHQFRIIRLWEESPERFLESSVGLLPLAIMTGTEDAEGTLRKVVRKIEGIGDNRLRSDIAAHSFVMAGLKLEYAIVQGIIRSEIMQESVTYQALRREAINEGLSIGIQQGIQQGKLNDKLETARKMLQRGFDRHLIAEITELSLEEIIELIDDRY